MARTTIDRRENGRYRARYQAPDRRWRSRTFDRRIDAQRWLNNELVKLDRGEWVDPRAGRVLFESVAERWLAGRVALRKSTQARDRSYLHSLVLPHLGDKPVGSVQPSDLEAWVADLMAEGKAPATVQKAWQIASGVFRLAVRDRLIALSPARDVRLPKIERSEPVAFTVEEVMRLADAIDPRYRALVLVGAFGGLRIGELAGLQLGDFDPLRSLIRVRRTASDVRGEVIVGPPKTTKSIRTVVLPRSITEQLIEHIARLDETGPEAWIFPAPEGGPIRRTAWMRRVWKRALAGAGLDQDLGTHTLRRSQVALLIAQGEHPKVIADRLGHTSVRTVLDVYGHLYEGADEAAAERLEAQLASRTLSRDARSTVLRLGN
ncbi:MAG: tyrosine-type recombinase/integrase [Acidimicrobiia bacterium]|nr:tyrosine-type recombinase/integrase [Acidimicrobiia bacterium]